VEKVILLFPNKQTGQLLNPLTAKALRIFAYVSFSFKTIAGDWLNLMASVVYYFVANFLLYRKHEVGFSKFWLYEGLKLMQAAMVFGRIYKQLKG